MSNEIARTISNPPEAPKTISDKAVGRAAPPTELAPSTEIGFLISVTILCLAPFLSRPFHIDDPLFVWTAKQIQSHPFDFYGFTVNWYSFDQPMSEVFKNPPLAAYYLAVVGSIFSFHEWTLHAAFLVPNLALVLGVYAIARRYCQHALWAALITFFTPAVMVSATTLMCDAMMLALWCWAIVAWQRGLDARRTGWFLLAGVLIALCALTKYFGVCLIPLLLAYTLLTRRGPGAWLIGLAIPIAALAAYEFYTHRLYGVGLFLDAPIYASAGHGETGALPLRMFLTTTYLGGALFSVLCFAPLLWSWRVVLAASAATIGAIAILFLQTSIGDVPFDRSQPGQWYLPIHVGLFALATAQVVALVATDLRRHRDATAALLALWVFGVVAFATAFNWAVNVRSLLPLAPAVGILVARRLDWRRSAWLQAEPRRMVWFAGPACAIALVVTWADFRTAKTPQLAARIVMNRYSGLSNPVWFEGHWGFQYYMQELGAQIVDFRRGGLRGRQILVLPHTNTNVQYFPVEAAALVDEHKHITSRWITTLEMDLGINFHLGRPGVPLPYAVVRAPRDIYRIFQLKSGALLRQN